MSEPTCKKPLLVILGPTASGKSALGLAAARRWGGEIVNCDSMQLIRGMEVGTAKPSAEERRRVPHHLFDRIDPDEFYNAGRYMREARQVCRDIAARGQLPVVVGGTGLYLRALLQGVFEGPGRSGRLRRRLDRIAQRRGTAFLHRLLERHDPASARQIASGDRVRLVRALEVFYSTGEPISRLQRRRRPLEGFEVRKVGLQPERAELYARIDARVQSMFDGGLLEEVRLLLARGYPPHCKGFEALGYREALDVVEGRKSLAEAVGEAAQRSRRYAKRQLTWFGKEPGVCWIPLAGDSPEAWPRLLGCLGEDFPGTPRGG